MPVSLNSLLATARSALNTHQAALQVVADNIANASTEGYTRKRVDLVEGTPQIQPEGIFGTGVFVGGVTQARDRFLDATHRTNISSQSYYVARSGYLGQVEQVFAEPGEHGLAASLDAFWAAWSDLANEPLSQSARVVVRERGDQLAAHFNRLADSLAALRDSSGQRLQSDIDQANTLVGQITHLNERIVAAEAGGQQAGSLRDARDLAVDRLASLVNIQVSQRGNGAIAIAVDGVTVVDGVDQVRLAVSTVGGTWRVLSERGAAVNVAGGSVGGYLSLLNDDLPGLQRDLDALADLTVSRVNTVHRAGLNSAGATGIDFFQPGAPGAAGIRLADAVAASAAVIAAGSPVLVAGVPSYAAGRNDIALAIAALRDPAAGSSLGEMYGSLVGKLGETVRTALDASETEATLVEQSARMRESVMGVSTDEELASLIQLQAAYAAAARVITVADDLFRTLVELKR